MVSLTNRPPTQLKKAEPVLPTCDFCQGPIRPGETHGVVEATAEGPEVKCYVVRVAQVETLT